MPKSAGRRKRIRAARSEAAPTALAPAATSEGGAAAAPKKSAAQSGKGAGGGSASKDKEQQLLPVVQKLKSTEASERLWSTSAISHILGASDSSTRRLLQSNNVVALLIGLLADPESQIQNEACGALRNLAIEGGFEVCAEMFNKSIVPALAKQLETIDGALTKVLAGAPAANDEEKNVHKLLWPWIENLSTLFWCLAETSDKAFKAVVAQSSLSTLLYTLLRRAIPADGSPASSSKVPLSAALAAAQAVYVLTDTNVPSAPKFPLPRDVSLSAAYSNTRSMLLELLRNTGDVTNGGETMAMFRILVIGVLQNLAQSQVHGKQALAGPGEKAEYASLALSALTSSLNSVDLMAEADAAAGVHAKLPVAGNGGTQGKATSSEAVDASAQKVQLDKVEQRWTRTRLSLEILGELVAELDGIVDVGLLGSEEYEEWGGISGQNGKGDGDEDADVMEQDGKDLKHAAANGTNGTTGPSALSAGTFSVFADLPKILLGLAQPTCISFAAASAAPASGSNAASSQLISTEPVGNAPAAAPSGPASNATYVPILSELASLIHSRALECLNNLLITIGRSVSEAPAASPSGDVLQVDGVDESLALLAEEDGQDEAMAGDDDEDVEEAGSDEGDVEEAMLAATEPQPDSTAPSYVSANLPSLQTAWETLFQLLVGYINVLQTQMQSKTSAATATANANAVKLAGKKKAGAAAAATSAQGEEPASLCIEACLGSVWALSRLCVDQLTVGKDEVSVLLGVLEASQSGSIDADSAVRCVGALGVLASRTRVSVEENKLIGSALLARVIPLAGASTPNSSDSECLTQILDSLIDVYSDERRAYDAPVFVEGNFLRTLEGAVAPYRKLVKGIDRRKHPELREAANAVATNLGDFVAYRKSLKL